MKNVKSLIALLICAILLIGVTTVPASAGSAITTLTKDSFAEELSGGDWHNANSDVIAKDGKIVFPAESSTATKLVWKNVAKPTDVFEEVTKGYVTLNFLKLPKNQKFYLCLGLKTVEADLAYPDTIQIEFENKNGINIKVVCYGQDGTAKTVASKNGVSPLNSPIKIDLLVTTKNKLTVSANGQAICNKAAVDFTGNGRLGFLQTGGCNVEVTDLEVSNYDYLRPQNSTINENFNDGDYNLNEFVSALTYASYHPAGIHIDKYKGQNALYFKNVRAGYFSTVNNYSNFEMEIDVLYYETANITNEKGELVAVRSTPFRIGLGCSTNLYDLGVNFDVLSGLPIIVGGQKSVFTVDGKEYPCKTHDFMAAENADRGFSLKIRMVDGLLRIYIKWLDETKYTRVVDYDRSYAPTPTGCIMIASGAGDRVSTSAIFDNLKITNFDENPNLITPEHVTNKFRAPYDDEYVQQEIIYKDLNGDTDKGFNLYLILAGVAALSILAVGITSLVIFIKKKKAAKKVEVVEDE